MSKNEKAYFKRYAKNYLPSGKSSNYLVLFDLLSQMENYDEKVLLQHELIIPFKKSFVETKQYLKKQLLKSLKASTGNQSIRYKLYEIMAEIEILFQKQIYDGCLSLIKKAEKIAQKY